MGKEAIIEKILSDARLRADAAIGEANAKADEILSAAAEQCKAYYSNSKSAEDVAVKDIISRSRTVAELDSKKLILGAKSEILDRVFDLALKKARELDKAEYKKLITGMLMTAEDGDVVTVSEREADIVTRALVADIAKKKGIKLTLSESRGDFDGGIILSGRGVDKNLTLEVEFDILRDSIESQIAKELFADVR